MKIISFSGYTSVWNFAFAEAVVAKTLMERGHNVLFITPGNEFSGKSNPLHEKILREEFALNGYTISTILTPEDRKEINSCYW